MISPMMEVNTGHSEGLKERKEEAANSRGITGDFQEEVIILCSTDSPLEPPRV